MTATFQTSQHATTGKRPSILIIEDSPDIREVLQAQLEFSGFTPVCVEDGASALKWLTSNQADLVILDLMLPGMDGIKVCQRIRRKYLLSTLPILMLSALGSQTYARIRGLRAGANDFLAKPYNLDELVAKIQVLLNVKVEKERTEGTLSRYVAPAVREQAKFDPDLLMRRQVQDAIVMFADLRGFTRLSTRTDLISLTDMLDQFFTGMMAVVNQHGGLVLDLTGDELLAVFNIPDNLPAASPVAVTTAVKMQELFRDLRKSWAGTGPKVGLGIGIHQGDVMVGNVGGEELMRYTVTGSVVNIAHRLVDLAEDEEIVISSEVYEQIKLSLKDFEFISLAPVNLKGIEKPQTIYKLHIPDSDIDLMLSPDLAHPLPSGTAG